MTGRKWRLDRTAAFGAAFGVLHLLVRSLSDDPELTSNVPRLLGNFVGSAICGVFFFLNLPPSATISSGDIQAETRREFPSL